MGDCVRSLGVTTGCSSWKKKLVLWSLCSIRDAQFSCYIQMLLCWDVESIQDTRNDDYRASNAWGPSREKVSSFISWQLLKRLHFVVYSTFYGSFELQKVQTEIYASYLYMNTPNVGLNGPVVYVLIYSTSSWWLGRQKLIWTTVVLLVYRMSAAGRGLFRCSEFSYCWDCACLPGVHAFTSKAMKRKALSHRISNEVHGRNGLCWAVNYWGHIFFNNIQIYSAAPRNH